MNYTDLQKAQSLSQERQTLTRAIDNFSKGGKIVALTVAPPMPEQPPDMPPMPPKPPGMMGTSVSTTDMNYPQQMVDSIKGSLQARLDAVVAELNTLGVSRAPEATR